MLPIIIFIIAVVTTVLAILWTCEDNWREVVAWISVVISVVTWVAFGIMLIAIIVHNVGIQGLIESNEQRYESLVYQLENDLYDNDNDLGKKELYNQIQNWNEDLAKGKALQHDFWIGPFYPDIYDQFEFIELR